MNDFQQRVSLKEIAGVLIGVVLVVSLLAYCKTDVPGLSDNDMSLNVPANISAPAKKLVVDSFPKIRKACPGLDKYSETLRQTDIIDSLNAEYAEYRKVTIVYQVPDGKSDIPGSYRAWGHTCYLDIAADGKSIAISKDPCKSVFTDNLIEERTGNDLVIQLN